MRLDLYWHTLRHLKSRQLMGQLSRRLKRLDLELKWLPQVRESSEPVWIAPWRTSALDGKGGFTFLNERRCLSASGGWNEPDVPKLWLYNLHYFDWINALPDAMDARCAAASVVMWIDRWIAENP